jgi:hypothetical protein
MKKRNTKVMEMRDASLAQARQLIRCGFELETQSSNGHHWRDNGVVDPDVDPNAIDEARYNTHIASQMATYERSLEAVFQAWPAVQRPAWMHAATNSELVSALNHMKIPNLSLLRSTGIINDEKLAFIRQQLMERVRREARRTDFRHQANRMPFTSFFHQRCGLSELIQVGSDGTVNGFEMRTTGPLTYDEFETAARSVFTLNHSIDVGCSFHIHLSVVGVEHRYSQRLQLAMTEYVIAHQAELPESVRERFRHTQNSRHFQSHVKNDKYTFVAPSREHNTWEFRCFGNVRDPSAAMVCLNLAIRAMQYAYQVAFGQKPLESEQYILSQEDWSKVTYEALHRGVSISAAAERLLSDGEIEQAA